MIVRANCDAPIHNQVKSIDSLLFSVSGCCVMPEKSLVGNLFMNACRRKAPVSLGRMVPGTSGRLSGSGRAAPESNSSSRSHLVESRLGVALAHLPDDRDAGELLGPWA